MAHMIESAKSGRASCRTCKTTITKGELRMGEEVANAFSPGEMTFNWHHLHCAAKKKPSVLKQALETTEVEIPDKDELLKTIETSGKAEKPTTYPYGEPAPTSRALCISCGEKIEKGNLRVAVESPNDGGNFMPRASYLHPHCAPEHAETAAEELFEKVKANSLNLSADQLTLLEDEMLD
jgi:hypothetical protein